MELLEISGLDDEDMNLLFRNLQGNKKLKTLNITDSRYLDYDIHLLTNSLKTTNISNLSLNIGMEGENVKIFAKSLPHTKIVELNMQMNHLEDGGAVEIAKVIPKTDIRKLNVRWNGIQKDGKKALIDAIPSSNLVELNLKSNTILLHGGDVKLWMDSLQIRNRNGEEVDIKLLMGS